MCTRSAVAAIALLLGSAASANAGNGVPDRLNLGTAPTQQELSEFFAIPPRGEGLPPGGGTVALGATVYAASCAACHGDDLQGGSQAGQDGEALVGGRGTLQSAEPVKTVESYWPYATTIFDYVKRAMPMDEPGSLSDEQIYCLTAFILFKAHIIDDDTVIDAKTLPLVQMPNRHGFVTDKNTTDAPKF